MKKFNFTVAAGLLCIFISCKDSSNTIVSSSSNSQAEKNLSRLHEIYRGIETGNISMLDTIAIQDYVDHLPGHDIRGRDSVKKYLMQIHEGIRDFNIDVLGESTSEDWVFTMIKMTGTTKMPMMGMPENAKMDMTIVDVIKVKDGMFVERWPFLNPKDMMKKMDSVRMK